MPATFTRTPVETERKDPGFGGKPPVARRPTGGGGDGENWENRPSGRRGPRDLLARYRMEIDVTQDKMVWTEMKWTPEPPKGMGGKGGADMSLEMLGGAMEPVRTPDPVNPPSPVPEDRLPQPVAVAGRPGGVIGRPVALDPQQVPPRHERVHDRQVDHEARPATDVEHRARSRTLRNAEKVRLHLRLVFGPIVRLLTRVGVRHARVHLDVALHHPRQRR